MIQSGWHRGLRDLRLIVVIGSCRRAVVPSCRSSVLNLSLSYVSYLKPMRLQAFDLPLFRTKRPDKDQTSLSGLLSDSSIFKSSLQCDKSSAASCPCAEMCQASDDSDTLMILTLAGARAFSTRRPQLQQLPFSKASWMWDWIRTNKN